MNNYTYDNLLVINNNNIGNYVKLSEEILEKLTNNKVEMPYYFLVESKTNGLCVYVGVKEFTGLDNCIEIPQYISEYLASDYVKISLVQNIPKCKTIKVKTENKEFLNIPEYDKFLERELSKYCILSKDQEIIVDIMDIKYKMQIIELIINIEDKDISCDLVDIVNIDVNIDIVAPEEKIDIPEETHKITPPPIPTDHTNDTNDGFNNLGSGLKMSHNNKKLSSNEIRLKRLEYYDKIFKSNTSENNKESL